MLDVILSAIFAYIPAPVWSGFSIGPITVHAYGMIIGVGTLIAVMWVLKRYEQRGHDGDTIIDPIFFGIIFGFLGARFTYLIPRFFDNTQDGLVFSEYLAQPWRFIAVWEGGIAILGGLAFGGITVLYMTRKRKVNQADLWDSAAPVLPLAQGIGRWGNYFNQELYGTPLDGVPWKLYIEPRYRRPGFEAFDYFHPTFLYESLWNFATVGLIIWLERKKLVPRGGLIFVFGISYAIIRLILEQLRTDEIIRYYGLSRNSYMAIAWIIFASIFLAILYKKDRNKTIESVDEPEPQETDEPQQAN